MDAKPSNSQLRNFGLVLSALLVGFIYFLIPYIHEMNRPTIILYICAALTLFALVLPKALYPIHIFWMKLGAVLGWINTRIILGIVFFLVVFPIGLVLKVMGKDFMRTKIDKDLESYRETSENRDIETLQQLF